MAGSSPAMTFLEKFGQSACREASFSANRASMAGTDHRQRRPGDRAPAVILIEPQLGENIGTAARAMANFGLDDLRLVRPRDGWPNEHARKAASGDGKAGGHSRAGG